MQKEKQNKNIQKTFFTLLVNLKKKNVETLCGIEKNTITKYSV
jgi:hypothetical protein